MLANAVHHALERFYGLPDEHRQPERLAQALRSVWPSHRRPDSFVNRADEREWGLKGLAMLDRYASRHDLHARPLAREVWIRRRLGRGPELYGKADRVDPDGDGLRVIDYKTGKREIERGELPHDSAAMLYASAATATYGRKVRSVDFVYLDSGRTVSWDLEDPAELQAAEARLERILDELRGGREWQAMPGWACRYCPFAHLCPARATVTVDDLDVAEEVCF